MVEKGKKDVNLGTAEKTGTIAKESSWGDKKSHPAHRVKRRSGSGSGTCGRSRDYRSSHYLGPKI